jgi:AhpD family alkylhydroperoxidase
LTEKTHDVRTSPDRARRGRRPAHPDAQEHRLDPEHGQGHGEQPRAAQGLHGPVQRLAGGILPAAVRERLALATAEYNRCTYCLSAHTFLAGNAARLDDAEIAEVTGNLTLNILSNYFHIVAHTDNESPRHAARAPLTPRRRGQPVIT